MNPQKEHTACPASALPLPVVYVARITPCRYSTRKAIRRYRCVQSEDTSEALAPRIQIYG